MGWGGGLAGTASKSHRGPQGCRPSSRQADVARCSGSLLYSQRPHANMVSVRLLLLLRQLQVPRTPRRRAGMRTDCWRPAGTAAPPTCCTLPAVGRLPQLPAAAPNLSMPHPDVTAPAPRCGPGCHTAVEQWWPDPLPYRTRPPLTTSISAAPHEQQHHQQPAPSPAPKPPAGRSREWCAWDAAWSG